MAHTYDAFVFDLDGTLLDTLPDLEVITNKALNDAGMPSRSDREILKFIGNGAKALICQAVPEGTDEQTMKQVLADWKALYPEFGIRLTQPYAGIAEVLDRLQSENKKLAVLSNKFDQGTKDCIARYFPAVFEIVYGEGPLIPRKPDPTGLKKVIAELGCEPERTLYIGDSPRDDLTARRAGATGICVSWGYHTKEELENETIERIIDSPQEILAYL